MNAAPPQCDFDDPGSVVSAFIMAMNAWEGRSWELGRACRNTDDPFSYQAGVLSEMTAIFAVYCTPKERKLGRNGSFQKPPEYDPMQERILHIEVDEDRKRAHVTTQREATLGGGRYRYAVARKEGRWLIDTLKREFEGDWENAIL